MSQGGAARLEFGADVQGALDGITRIELKLGQMEGAMKKVADSSRKAKEEVKDIGDKGAESMEKAKKKTQDFSESLESTKAAILGVTAALVALEQVQSAANAKARGAGQSYMATMARTGDTEASGWMEDSFKAMMKKTGMKMEEITPTYEAMRQISGNDPSMRRRDLAATSTIIQAADIMKMTPEQANAFGKGAASLMKADPNLSAKEAAGRAGLIYRSGADPGAVYGFAQQANATPDETTAVAVMAQRSQQDFGKFTMMVSKIIQAQEAGGETVKLADGRTVKRRRAELYNPDGSERRPAEVLLSGLRGEIPGFEENYGGRGSLGMIQAIQRGGGYDSIMAEVKNSAGYFAATERGQKAARGTFGSSAQTQEVLDDMAARKELNQMERGANANVRSGVIRKARIQAEAEKDAASAAVFAVPGMAQVAGASAYFGLNAPMVTQMQVGAMDFERKRRETEANYARGALADGGHRYTGSKPNVSVSGPPGSQINVNVTVENAGQTTNASTP